MSPKNPVLQLSYMCLRIVSNQVITALADDETLSSNYKVVEQYMSEATYEVLQDLLRTILSAVNLDAGTRFNCLQLLLREDVSRLDTGMFPHSYYEDILRVIQQRGVRLQQLNLKGVWARDHPSLLSQLIRSLKYLTVLMIPHMANDEVLEAVLTLQHLVVLDVCGEAAYTAHGITKLQSATLKVLEIGSFGKQCLSDDTTDNGAGPAVVARLLQQLPSLTHLKIYSFTGLALAHIADENPQFQTKLKYFHDTNTSLQAMDVMLQMCPDLESVHIDNPEQGTLLKIHKFKYLNSLKVTRPTDDLDELLRKIGDRLSVLKINHRKQRSLNLSDICLNCPNLTTLECFQSNLTVLDFSSYFMALENVEILYCDNITDSLVRFILSNSPFLKRIIIGCIIHMTDGDIFRLCAENAFQSLEELWFSCARSLTATSVELLMGHCPNLKVIGQLSGWDVQQDDVDYLRAVIAATNTDLTLLPVGHFP